MKKKQETLIDIILILLIAIFCISISPKTLQNDTFYTISIGKHIIEEKQIDMKDPFSWHENLPYTYPHWLYDVIIYLIYNAGGMEGIYISTCIFCAILGIVLYKTNSKISGNKYISFIIAILSIYILRGFIAARAQLVTFTLFVLTLYFIEQFLKTKKKRYAIGLIAIPILIANLHTAVWPFYFVIYLPYIAEYIIELIAEFILEGKSEIFFLKLQIKRTKNEEKKNNYENKLKQKVEKAEKIKQKRKNNEIYKLKLERNDNVKWLILIMTICAFTGLLTPLGPTTPYTYLIKTMQGNTTNNINEHLPMTLVQHEEILCVIVVYLAILIFTKCKIYLRDLLMLGGLVYLMLRTRRQQTMFILLGSFIANKMICELIREYFKDEIKNVSDKTKAIATLVTIFVFCGSVIIYAFNEIDKKEHEEYVDQSAYPVDASTFILTDLDYKNIRIYNEYNYGSYMLYRGIPVFIDSRCDLYAPEYNTPTGKVDDGQDIFMDFLKSSNIDVFYEDIFKKYNITHCILYRNSKMNLIIENTNNGEYNKIYQDKFFVIYEVMYNL